MESRNSEAPSKGKVFLLDYGAGNVRSVRNAIKYLEYEIEDITSPAQLSSLPSGSKLIFPGVGNFTAAMKFLTEHNYAEPLKEYILSAVTGISDRYYFGICLGMQTLFQASEEYQELTGLGVIPGNVMHFKSERETELSLSVPHIGWNQINASVNAAKGTEAMLKRIEDSDRVYFVHSYCARVSDANKDWVLTTTNYGGDFISAIGKGNVFATQFHPEKSGRVGLQLLQNFLELGSGTANTEDATQLSKKSELDESKANSNGNEMHAPTKDDKTATGLSKRVIACLDVRRDESDALVVTKGLGYDVVSKASNKIRNMGDPVLLAEKYFQENCDELSFLSIMSWNEAILGDSPLHRLLEKVSEKVFVPLSIGGGIRSYRDEKTGTEVSALEIASKYFRSGADKVSIGSDAVRAVQKYLENGKVKDGSSSIEQISIEYGCQAVVVSVDPKRVYFDGDSEAEKEHQALGRKIFTVEDLRPEKKGSKAKCVYLATVSGGKKVTEVDVIQLVTAVEDLGAGELLLNCIDFDGQKIGFDIDLIKAVCEATTLPVIASSGAGCKEHFSELFQQTRAEAGLAAGMFHREETTVQEVKDHLVAQQIPTRR